MTTCIAVIPARAGSKGLPGKNTAHINGKSLIQLAIEAAISLPVITRVVVTSDDVAVQKIAREMGAEVVVRPAELAQDNSLIELAVLHAITSLNIELTPKDALTVIQPTSPLRDSQLLARSLSTFIASGSHGSVFGVVDTEHHPAKMLKVDGDFVVPFTKVEDLSTSRQSLDRIVRQSGSLYITNLQQFVNQKSLFIQPVRWVMVGDAEATDIDAIQDLERARKIALPKPINSASDHLKSEC